MSAHQLVSTDRPVALSDMTVPQLTAAAKMLEQCQERYDKLSGICATMRGLVFVETKAKLERGKWLPWLAEHFGKTRKTAAQDMRLAAEFCKCNPKVTFEILGRDLASTIKELDQAQIDLKHPLVREVAKWVGDRTRYQLLLDFPGGYDRTEKGKGRTGVTSETGRQQAEKLLLPALQQFVERWRRGLWVHLPKSILDQIDGDLLDIRKQIAKAAKK